MTWLTVITGVVTDVATGIVGGMDFVRCTVVSIVAIATVMASALGIDDLFSPTGGEVVIAVGPVVCRVGHAS